MTEGPKIAIAGSTGLVGSEMLAILEERKIKVGELALLASKDSKGELYAFRGEQISVQALDEFDFQGTNFVLGATSASLAEEYIPKAIDAGAQVIDNSSRYRMEPDVPLVVPEVNYDNTFTSKPIIANPNCSTIQLVPVLAVAHQLAGLRRVVVSTYQSVSGAGREALEELFEQTRSVFSQSDMPTSVFGEQIAFNCIPKIDAFTEDGYTKEEKKVILESRKILGLPDLAITCTAVRVPAFSCHAESVNIELQNPLSPEEFTAALSERNGFRVSEPLQYETQVAFAGNDEIAVSRIRQDSSVDHGLNCWVLADNIRKGAALNAVQILERLLAH